MVNKKGGFKKSKYVIRVFEDGKWHPWVSGFKSIEKAKAHHEKHFQMECYKDHVLALFSVRWKKKKVKVKSRITGKIGKVTKKRKEFVHICELKWKGE